MTSQGAVGVSSLFQVNLGESGLRLPPWAVGIVTVELL
jgi:hypothetical protein